MRNSLPRLLKVGNVNDFFWINKHRAALLLDVSEHTLKTYRKVHWLPGIHFQHINAKTIRYNRLLIIDWVVNISYPEVHQRAIQTFLASLPSNQSKRRSR